MKKLFFAAAIMLLGCSAFAQNTNNILSDYFSLKDALVSGDSKAASRAAATLQQSIKAGGNLAQKDALLTATDAILKAGSIDKQRAAFNDLSTNMWQVVKGAEKVKSTVYYQYCPMKKAYWLSGEKEIKNPYFGSAMLTCGKVVETK